MKENGKQSPQAVQRLCSEIQLFDLCDRDACDFKVGRFCTNPDLLDRFERISEDDRRPAVRTRPSGEGAGDDDEAEYGDGDADDYDLDDLADDGEEWEDE